MSDDFQPVIIGTDVNAYNVARAFNMEYGIVSKVFGTRKLVMVSHSGICDVTEVPGFSEDEIMVETLINYAEANKEKKLILFASSEQYIFRLFNNYDKLKKLYYLPYTEPEQGIALSDKMAFYEYCERFDLDYAPAQIIEKSTYHDFDLQIEFPMVLKPIESSDYFDLQFEGKEKVYILQNKQELIASLTKTYENGYQHNMVVQEYIQGDVTNEFVANVYSDRNGKVKLMSLGRILIEDPQPAMRGNYIAIMSPPNDEAIQKVYQDIKRFLEAINFTGLSNFDLKYDQKDGKYKFFEINMRQGRSSFFSVLAGANYAIPIVNDFIKDLSDSSIIYGNDSFVSINCSKEALLNVVKEHQGDFYEKVSAIDNIQNTLYYEKDMSFLRKMQLKKYFKMSDERLLEYMNLREEEE